MTRHEHDNETTFLVYVPVARSYGREPRRRCDGQLGTHGVCRHIGVHRVVDVQR